MALTYASRAEAAFQHRLAEPISYGDRRATSIHILNTCKLPNPPAIPFRPETEEFITQCDSLVFKNMVRKARALAGLALERVWGKKIFLPSERKAAQADRDHAEHCESASVGTVHCC